jgi:predicted glycoside hydrolase/deacetylase ChbG (UPF0249 family)
VCADDYGFTPGVSEGIRQLLAAGRISATSVMTSCEPWPAEAAALKAVAGAADIGLHVTLTDQEPIGRMPELAPDGRFPAMPALYKAAVLRRLPLGEIEAEIERQVAAFVVHYGAPPAHIDGHHHVHQLPGIRDIVVKAAARIGPGRTWVRCCAERPALIARRGVATAKALVIGSFGGAVARRAKAAGVPVNDGFSGAYDYLGAGLDIEGLFRRFLTGARRNTVVMCHPGRVDEALARRDVMVAAREAELAFLASEAWPALLAEMGCEVGPLIRDR